MKTFASRSAKILLVVLALLAPQVMADAGFLHQQFHGSAQKMVLSVKQTENPSAKRQIMGDFLNGLDRSIGIAEKTASEKDVAGLHAMRLQIQADYAALNATGVNAVSDAQLNDFAGYVQQDLEQADYIYISAGALIIILIILLLLVR